MSVCHHLILKSHYLYPTKTKLWCISHQELKIHIQHNKIKIRETQSWLSSLYTSCEKYMLFLQDDSWKCVWRKSVWLSLLTELFRQARVHEMILTLTLISILKIFSMYFLFIGKWIFKKEWAEFNKEHFGEDHISILIFIKD